MMQYYFEKRSGINCKNSFVAIDETEDFCITKNSIYSKSDRNSEIGVYSIKTQHREVSEWVQPLWRAENKGVVVLYCRNYTSNINLEFLLTVQYEKGISGNLSISASYLRYPNEKIEKSLAHAGETLYEFHQSDEGGRFINHEYLFRVAEVQNNIQIEENQYWVNIVELKNILSIHNMENIQLRNICSALIEQLNPNIFKHQL
jgi:oxidase EvaA